MPIQKLKQKIQGSNKPGTWRNMESIRSAPKYNSAAAAAAKLLQSCPTLCDPIDGSPPGSAVPGILQETTLERVAISFSNAWKWKVKVKSLSHVRLLATPWTAAHQGFSRQEYWSGLPLPSLVLITILSKGYFNVAGHEKKMQGGHKLD